MNTPPAISPDAQPRTVEEAKPVRIQRKRTAGWRMPENTVYVGRPSQWGNPFRPEQASDAGYRDGHAMAAYAFRRWLAGDPIWFVKDRALDREFILTGISALRGKNLACWCRLVDHRGNYQPCHADVLLSLANDVPMDEVIRENLRRTEREKAQ
jgi:hypothetical protein